MSASRARGALPYLVPPEHTAAARAALGGSPLLLPEQTAILCDTAEEARGIGTDWLRAYLALPNYADNLLRSGFSDDDLAPVSDRLFDSIIACGDEEAAFPREQWRRIAAACKDDSAL